MLRASKKLNSSNNHVSLEVDPFPDEPLMRPSSGPHLDFCLQGTQLSLRPFPRLVVGVHGKHSALTNAQPRTGPDLMFVEPPVNNCGGYRYMWPLCPSEMYFIKVLSRPSGFKHQKSIVGANLTMLPCIAHLFLSCFNHPIPDPQKP